MEYLFQLYLRFIAAFSGSSDITIKTAEFPLPRRAACSGGSVLRRSFLLSEDLGLRGFVLHISQAQFLVKCRGGSKKGQGGRPAPPPQ